MCVAKNVAVSDLISEVKVRGCVKDERSSEAASACGYVCMSGVTRKTARYLDLIFCAQHIGDPNSSMANFILQNG